MLDQRFADDVAITTKGVEDIEHSRRHTSRRDRNTDGYQL